MPKRHPTEQEIQQRNRQAMFENYRQTVAEEELLARMNKATFEKMEYYIKGAALVPEYSRLVQEQDKLRQQQAELAQSQGQEILQAALNDDGSVSIESAAVIEQEDKQQTEEPNPGTETETVS